MRAITMVGRTDRIRIRALARAHTHTHVLSVAVDFNVVDELCSSFYENVMGRLMKLVITEWTRVVNFLNINHGLIVLCRRKRARTFFIFYL